MSSVIDTTRTQALKARTHATHEQLDQRIMANQPFANRENYSRFLEAQYRFLRDADALYDNPELAALFPDLAERRRYHSIAADLADLGRPLPQLQDAPISETLDVATAMGWLYVVEGSKLGAVILYKLAGKLGLDERCGARHLAGHPDGRARHWRAFTAVLDGLRLDEAAEARVSAGAAAAFACMNGHLDQVYA
ncbi:biliverdin-producing heme oxygenase [Chromobacterium phragmitis]|uniref:biliverdin-producing heme oxygenase n=1 Tax=Chromobacterium amazonense TaxID=1382803 RepID=UPI0021B81526|nr:biliverdin-producing heme oxygenase [Chromobacterium amazonense]MBM2886155.1 biliverdin-producing heme oxygenase [Chromobacterium amazonense]MDE1713409.1 biliverdin-producing heme oxygenase [Chromobacterium amazonense]